MTLVEFRASAAETSDVQRLGWVQDGEGGATSPELLTMLACSLASGAVSGLEHERSSCASTLMVHRP